jgi:Uma2 family endonuclease
MVGAVRKPAPMLSVASFRAWLASRPDEEHWELIEGVPMMMTPPNRRHQRIASNLEALLNAALRRHDPAFAAYHDIGVNIVSAVPYDPEPDVAVIREDENPDPRYAERFYLVAEVLSESDKGVIESKREHLPRASILHVHSAGPSGPHGDRRGPSNRRWLALAGASWG